MGKWQEMSRTEILLGLLDNKNLWPMPVNSALRKLRQGDRKLKGILDYTMSFKPVWATEENPVSKKDVSGGEGRNLYYGMVSDCEMEIK
jgi:hypothetical protein